MTTGHDLAALTGLAAALVRDDRRVLLGIAGAPGSGKTTLATRLVAALAATDGLGPGGVAHLPMDGFHLADASLERRGLRDRKGAPETFDVGGFVATLRRVREEPGLVYVPGFERDLEQPLAAALEVPGSARLVVTEGNYLLLDDAWAGVRPLLDACWFVEVADVVRLRRLVARHVEFGKASDEAVSWVERVDEPNARIVAATRADADLVVDGAGLGGP